MRTVFKLFSTVSFIVAISLSLGTSLSAEALVPDATKALRKEEARGLNAVPSTRLASLLSAPKQKSDVKFSRDWLAAQEPATGNANWSCLTEALYFEARGETLKGQFAVAEVIMNRVKSSRFPDNICGVIKQGTGRKYQCQFTFTCDGAPETIHEPAAYAQVGKVARAVLDGRAPDLTGGATHYHTTAVNPNWSNVYKKTAAIGVHVFYRHNYRTATN